MGGVIVLTHDAPVADAARQACSSTNRAIVVARELAGLATAARSIEWDDAVIDMAHPHATEAISQLGASTDKRLFSVVRELTPTPIAGVDAIVVASVLQRSLGELAYAPPPRPLSFERLASATVLGGPIDDAIDGASHELAVAFGVARCILSDRSEPTGPVPVEGATWDAEAWNATSRTCRIAAALGTSTIVPAASEPGACDTYYAVRLESPRGGVGFVCLHATGARVFPIDHRVALRGIAGRLGRELRWRAMYDSTTDELERSLAGPGLDPLLAIWNRTALDQLAHAHMSAAKRYKLPMTALAIRVVDLEGVNTRLGMATGDTLLRRIADGLKPALRAEDLVGRFSGTVLVVILQGTGPDDAKGVAERIQAMLAERSLELEHGGTHKIETSIGLSAMREDEDAALLLARAARAARTAPDNSIALAQGPTTLTGRQAPHTTDAPATQRATLGGSYRLRHEISRGGMGVVYRADDLALERPVAIKMLRPDLAEDKELVQHLRKEAALLARMQHPNLVQIYNFGSTDGECYFVMELVEGETLQQAIDRHRAAETQVPVPELLGVIDQIASALDALHDRGIIHRDVKPANFIRDPFSGRSVLVDVGIAHSYGERSKQAGTPGYMAPEIMQGEPASARADVYGLAASVVAIATLAHPWGDGDPIDILNRQCSDPPLRASSRRAELEPIDELLAEALSADPEKRPASAGGFARALAQAYGTILPAASSRSAQRRRKTDQAALSAPRTRGVVFRSVARALGVRDADRLRDALGSEHAELATTLASCAPLGWAPTELLVELMRVAPPLVARDTTRFARDIARATVRSSFRSFFPASAATLHPDRTLSAIRSIWTRYHSWGNVSALPLRQNDVVVKISDTPKVRPLCEWTCEMLDTLLVLSGATSATTIHERCETEGDDACVYRVTWKES